MQIKWQNIDNLIPYERNAKLHPDSQVARIARSIEEFGFRNPVLLDGQGEIIAGHGRILGAKRAGLTEVPTIDASDMTPEQVRAYRIADNKLAESDWSLSALSEELMDLQGLDFDLTLLGFDDDKLTELMVDPENKGLTNPDTVPGTPKTPKTKAGDVWLLDNHRLVCGDCCEFDLVSRLFAGKTARLLLTDPPYNVNYGEKATYLANGRGGQKRNIKNDHMKDEAFAAFLRDVFASCFAVLAPGDRKSVV